MIGKLNQNIKKVNVVGGGISGLLASYRLIQLGYNVTIYEASNRLGGLISSKKTPEGLVEKAAHSILMNAEVSSFFSEIGVKVEPKIPNCKSRYVLRAGKFRKIPLNLIEIVRALYGFFFIKVKKSNPTFEEFGNSIFGSAVTKYLINPFLSGVYGAPPSQIKVKLAYPQFPIQFGKTFFSELVRTKKLNKKEPSEMVAIQGGMESVVRQLEVFIASRAKLKLGTLFDEEHFNQAHLSENVLFCIPAHQLPPIFKKLDPALATAINVPYSPLSTATVFTKKTNKNRKKGVGVLLAEREVLKEKFGLLGILFNSDSFLNRVESDQVESFSAMFNRQVTDADVYQVVKECLGIDAPSVLSLELQYWPQAIPVYGEQLECSIKYLNKMTESRLGLAFFGNYTGKVSIRGLIESLKLFQPYLDESLNHHKA